MKSETISALVLAAGFFATGAFAGPLPTTPAPAPVAATPPAPAPAPTPGQVVYAQQLPSAAELTGAAAAQGLTVKQIIQSPRDLNVTFESADGQIKIVSYRLLSDFSASPVRAAAPPTVYVMPPPSVYYYDPFYYDPFYPAYWYPPVSVRFGFGYGFGHGHGHGHYRH